MPIAAPDFESCDPKCRCLGGELAGTVYNCAKPCSQSNEEFNADSCECIEDFPIDGVNCCRSRWEIDYTVNHPTSPNCSGLPWEDIPVDVRVYTDRIIDLPVNGKFLGYRIHGTTSQFCAGYNAAACADTWTNAIGVDVVMGPGFIYGPTTTIDSVSGCGRGGDLYAIFELCAEWNGYPAGSTLAYRVAGTYVGGTMYNPNIGHTIDDARGVCPEGTRFNDETCACEEYCGVTSTWTRPAMQYTWETCLCNPGSFGKPAGCGTETTTQADALTLVSGEGPAPHSLIVVDEDGVPTGGTSCAYQPACPEGSASQDCNSGSLGKCFKILDADGRTILDTTCSFFFSGGSWCFGEGADAVCNAMPTLQGYNSDECANGYEINLETCECEPDNEEGGTWRYEGVITQYSGGNPTFVPVSTQFAVGAGDVFGIISDANGVHFTSEPSGIQLANGNMTVTRTSAGCSGGGIGFSVGFQPVSGSIPPRLLGSGVINCGSPAGATTSISGSFTKI